MELPVRYLFAALLWVLWCALHSTLVAATVTDYMRKKLGDWFRFYRILYSVVSLVTLIPLVYYSNSIQQAPFFRWEGHLVIVKYLIVVTSIFLFITGARHYSMSQLLGIYQIKTGRENRAASGYGSLDTSGILGGIRHPWYTAGILLVWTADLSLSNLLINSVISAYFVIGTFLEEKKLLLEFGERYREYQRNVSMFIPYKWLRVRLAGRRDRATSSEAAEKSFLLSFCYSHGSGNPGFLTPYGFPLLRE